MVEDEALKQVPSVTSALCVLLPERAPKTDQFTELTL